MLPERKCGSVLSSSAHTVIVIVLHNQVDRLAVVDYFELAADVTIEASGARSSEITKTSSTWSARCFDAFYPRHSRRRLEQIAAFFDWPPRSDVSSG
jgi:hypothetical protein